jgi:hypothetical protein
MSIAIGWPELQRLGPVHVLGIDQNFAPCMGRPIT